MADTVKKMSFVIAMRDFFGLKEGETNTQFMHEIKALTADDRAFFSAELAKRGYEIVAA